MIPKDRSDTNTHLLKSSLNKQIQSQNLNLNILNFISKPKAILNEKQKPSNLSLNTLAEILKHKNSKFEVYRHQKQQVREWLKDKGVDFRKIQEQIQNNAKVAEQMQIVIPTKAIQIIKIPEQQLRILPKQQRQAYLSSLVQGSWGFTPQTQLQFIHRQKQHVLNLTILKSLNQNRPKITTRSVLLNKIRKQPKGSETIFENQFKREREQETFPKPSYKQNMSKRTKYFNFVQALSVNGFQKSLQKLKDINSFWYIVISHIKVIQNSISKLSKLSLHEKQNAIENFQLKLNSLLMLESLRMVEKKYQSTLADFYHQPNKLKDQVISLQSRNKQLRVWKNTNNQPTWALAYFLFRAGRMVELRRVLENVDNIYIQEFVKYQQSVDQNYPQPSVKKYDLSKFRDSFFNQLVYVLKGLPKFQAEVTDMDFLDTTWIILRTLGIYSNIPEKYQQYQQILDYLFAKQTEQRSIINKQDIQKYLYLGGYKQTLRFCEVSFNKKNLKETSDFNNDDYFHLFMIVNYYPQLCGLADQKQINYRSKKYSEFLLKYLESLYLQQQFKILPAYLLLAPPQQIQNIACKFINTRQKYQKFEWRMLKQLMIERDEQKGQRTFEQLALQVLNQLKLTSFYDYVFAAEKYRTKFYNHIQSIFKQQQLSLLILLKKLYFSQKKKFQILTQNEDLKSWKDQILKFFQLDNHHQDKLVQKQAQFLRQVTRCERILQEKRLPQHQKNTQYQRTVIYPYEFYCEFNLLTKILETQYSNTQNIKNFIPRWFQNMQLSHLVSPQSKAKPIPVLLEYLSSYGNISFGSLYIFYLVSLIHRQGVIYGLQCDYYGLVQFKRVVLRELDNLQRYFQKSSSEDKGWKLIMNNFYYELVNSHPFQTSPFLYNDQYQVFKNELKLNIQIFSQGGYGQSSNFHHNDLIMRQAEVNYY